MICCKCIVTGRVQGVYFRASTRAQAQQLGITGYASNLPDGSVEVLACGTETAVTALQQWLWQGPPASKVTSVECEAVTVDPPKKFTTA
jgi:acylphosphatase